MTENLHHRSIIAFAGRRMDPRGTDEERFAFKNVPAVHNALAALFRRECPLVVVASAACGADLLALDAADQLGSRIRIVLPFRPERFKESSVVDRPHPEFWGPLFDDLIVRAESRGDLVVLDANDGPSAYAATNRAIIREAALLSNGAPVLRRLAVIAWDGSSRGARDLTQQFASLAEEAGFTLAEVSTVDPDAGSR